MTYRLRFHTLVERDLDAIARWIIDHVGAEVAHRTLTEIEQTITNLAHFPHRGSVRDDTVPGLRALPAGRKAVVAFTVEDTTKEFFISAVTYGNADWIARSRSRSPREP